MRPIGIKLLFIRSRIREYREQRLDGTGQTNARKFPNKVTLENNLSVFVCFHSMHCSNLIFCFKVLDFRSGPDGWIDFIKSLNSYFVLQKSIILFSFLWKKYLNQSWNSPWSIFHVHVYFATLYVSFSFITCCNNISYWEYDAVLSIQFENKHWG